MMGINWELVAMLVVLAVVLGGVLVGICVCLAAVLGPEEHEDDGRERECEETAAGLNQEV